MFGKSTLKLVLAGVLTLGAMSSGYAGTLESLERERANLLNIMLSGDIGMQERQNKLSAYQARLVDLERMVLRDKSLVGKNTPIVRSAFANYDLTFLVHASIEKDRLLMDHWFEQLGLTGQNILNARVGRR